MAEPTIFLNITHGFQARMLLRSQICEVLLNRGAKVVVSSVNVDEPYFAAEFHHPQIQLVKMATQSGPWESRLTSLRQYLLMNPSLGRTLNHKRERLRQTLPVRYHTTRAANLVLGNIPALRMAYMYTEGLLFPAREFDPVYSHYKPDLVVTGTPGFNLNDVHAIRAAKRQGIPTATVMLSWDNLTSKGFMNGTPDYLLVWSKLMADEAVEYHDFPRSRIFETGAAQFDIYHNAKREVDIKQWRSDNEIPPNAFLMVYGTINPGICDHEIDILRALIGKMREANIGKTPFLWIRLHPQVVNGLWKKSLYPFRELEANDVHVEIPPVNESKLDWDLPKADSIHLRNLLASSDLVITTSSTLSIDAACVDTPIVNIFFDGTRVADNHSVARFKKYTHYEKLLKTGGIFIADTLEQFAEAMERYCHDPLADRSGRQMIASLQLGEVDGRAGFRTAEMLLDIAEFGTT